MLVLLTLLVVALSAVLMAWVCLVLHRKLDGTPAVWLVENVYCAALQVFLMLLMCALLFPQLFPSYSLTFVIQQLGELKTLGSIMNWLFLTAVCISLIPVIKRPVFALPFLACISLALLFDRLADEHTTIEWLPALNTNLVLMLLMVLIYQGSRWIHQVSSEWIERRFNISDSLMVIEPVTAVTLQFPVLFVYARHLRQFIDSSP